MTSPGVASELYLPKSYIFERKNRAYRDLAFMTRQDSTLDYVYLPKGLSSITVTATGMKSGFARVWIYGANGLLEPTSDGVYLSGVTQRVWSGQISNPGEGNQGLWLKVQAWNITNAGMDNGSVAVQIVNFPPET